MTHIVWYSIADDSWGECLEGDLIVLKLDEMSAEDQQKYDNCQHDDEVKELLVAINNKEKNSEAANQ